MDTTPEYVKMCEKAVEVQDLHDVAEGDVAASIYENGYVHATIANELDIGWTGVSGTWLPRQDQLQEMVAPVYVDPKPRKLAKALWDWIAATAPKPDDSMEKLWLCFVMKERYSKTWTGEDWVKKQTPGDTMLVYCRHCNKTHAVKKGEEQCAPGAWAAINEE